MIQHFHLQTSIIFICFLLLLLSSCTQKILIENVAYPNRTFYLNWKNDSVKFKFNPERLNCVINNHITEKDITLFYNDSGKNISKYLFLEEYGKKELVQIERTIFKFEKDFLKKQKISIEYLNLIEEADDSLKISSFKSALKHYKKAHRLSKKEQYPIIKIKEIKRYLKQQKKTVIENINYQC